MNTDTSSRQIMLDLDYLRDFLTLGRRFAAQEGHHFLQCLMDVSLAEVDRLEASEPQSQPSWSPTPGSVVAASR